MTDITLIVTDAGRKNFTIKAENKSLVSAVVNVKNGNEIINSDVIKLQEACRKGGDLGALENCDLNGIQKIALAKLNGFNEYYDISLTENGMCLAVRIKETPWYVENPTLGTIKADFGVPDHIFVQGRNIPFGNADIINKRSVPGSTPDGRNTDYDKTKFEAGDVINIPIAQINIDGSPRGGFGRFFLQ